MKPGPVVSIVMPAHNRAALIGSTIQSVLEQTWNNWELIVVDDASTDNTRAVIADYRDTRIRCITIPHTGKAALARKAGVAIASGKYVAFLDSDDLWRRDKLEWQVNLFDQHPEIFFILSNGDEVGESAIQTPDYETLFIGKLFFPMLLEEKFCLYIPTLIFRREIYDAHAWQSTGRDFHMYYCMSYKYVGAFTNEKLVTIRKHQTNSSTKNERTAYTDTLVMLLQFLNSSMLTKRMYTHLAALTFYKLGLVDLRNREFGSAARAFFNSAIHRPYFLKAWLRAIQAMVSVGLSFIGAGNLIHRPG